MKQHYFIPILLFFLCPVFVSAGSTERGGDWNKSIPVYQVLKELGEPMPAHYLPLRDQQAVKQGEELVNYGVTTGPDGIKTPVQSSYFVCIDCHNVRREDPSLKRSDPETRLDYAIQNRLRFLPGTTFYGVVNRTTWYNGDYLKKYEDAATANNNLVNAIQLCATQCAMGRKLDHWELQAVLGYFWSLELTLEDLNLSQSDWTMLKRTFLQSNQNDSLISWLKGMYLHASPATFSKPSKPIIELDRHVPNIENGKAVYVLSCLSCHQADRATSLTLANSAITYELLSDHTDYDADFSVYKAIRSGIKASPGKGYMPNFSIQRMSNNQMRDLRAFINYQATHEPVALEPYIDWIR